MAIPTRIPLCTVIVYVLFCATSQLSASCGPEGFAQVETKRVEVAISAGNEPSFLSNFELPVDQLQNTLQVLDLSSNRLEMVPETVCMLAALRELNLSKYVCCFIRHWLELVV